MHQLQPHSQGYGNINHINPSLIATSSARCPTIIIIIIITTIHTPPGHRIRSLASGSLSRLTLTRWVQAKVTPSPPGYIGGTGLSTYPADDQTIKVASKKDAKNATIKLKKPPPKHSKPGNWRDGSVIEGNVACRVAARDRYANQTGR